MRILHLISNYNLPLYKNLLKAIAPLCREQMVFYPHRRDYKSCEEDLNRIGVHCIQSPIFNNLTRFFLFYKLFLEYQSIMARIDVNNYDFIHAHTIFSDGGLAYLLFRRFKIPYLVAVRSTDIDSFLYYKPWLKPFAKEILKNAISIVCISPNLEKQLKEIFNNNIFTDKIHTIPNGIDSIFLDSYKSYKVINKKQGATLLYVGRFLSVRILTK